MKRRHLLDTLCPAARLTQSLARTQSEPLWQECGDGGDHSVMIENTHTHTHLSIFEEQKEELPSGGPLVNE